MSLSKPCRLLAAAATGCAVLALEVDARASIPNCSALGATDGGAIIYGAGGSAQLPLITAVATELAKLSPPVHIVYGNAKPFNACVGYGDLVAGTTGSGTTLPTANYFDGTGSQTVTCTLDEASGPFTFAVMGNSPDLCPPIDDSGVPGLAPGFGEFLGPVQPVDYVVPSQSSQNSISTEAAYYIWGFDAAPNYAVATWTVPDNIFTRTTTSFVSLFVSLDTGVPVATVAVSGTSETSNTGTVSALAKLNDTPTDAATGIGFVSGEVADGNRGSIKVLAYQHTGQTCGYWPDSTPNAFDKANIRSGQYWLWSPVHFYAAVNGGGDGGTITDPNTAWFINLFTAGVATAAAPGSDAGTATGIDVFSDEVIDAFTVPQCAMQAWRDSDLGAPYSFAPAEPCTCKFDIATNNANKAPTCQTCAQDSDCSTNHCRNIGAPLPVIDADGGIVPPSTDAGAVGYCEAY